MLLLSFQAVSTGSMGRSLGIYVDLPGLPSWVLHSGLSNFLSAMALALLALLALLP